MTDAKPSKLDRLLSKQRQLAQEIAAINAREKAGERKADTRRKILIGGAVLASHRHGDFTEKQLVALLDGFLTYPRDRALFPFLPPRPDDAKEEQGAAPSASVPDLSPTPPVAAALAATLPLEPTDAEPAPKPRPKAFSHDPSPRKEDYL